MDRKLISRRIGSILDDISRLSNALYAMDTTDIQRYPDNYEILSTDAALRAERIACRLRHLIYSSTSIQKGEYLQSASVAQGISIAYENGVLEVTLPGLLPKRRQRQSSEFLLDPLYFALEQYAKVSLSPITGIVLSALPKFTIKHFPPGGCVIMTIWRKSSCWICCPPL